MHVGNLTFARAVLSWRSVAAQRIAVLQFFRCTPHSEKSGNHTHAMPYHAITHQVDGTRGIGAHLAISYHFFALIF